MEIKAKLLEIFDTVSVSDKFRKREFVVEYAENPQYPEYIKFELIQDRCEALDQFEVGQEIEVFFNLKGRKWTNPQGEVKYFNSLQAWRVVEGNIGEPVAHSDTPSSSPPSSSPPSSSPPSQDLPPIEAYNNNEGGDEIEEDDLPF